MVRRRGVQGRSSEAPSEVGLLRQQPIMLAQGSQKRAVHSPALWNKSSKLRSRRKIAKRPKTNIVAFFLKRLSSALDPNVPTTGQDHPEDLQNRRVRKVRTYKLSQNSLKNCNIHAAAARKVLCGEERIRVRASSLCNVSNVDGDAANFKSAPLGAKGMSSKPGPQRRRKRQQNPVPMDNVLKIKRRVKNALVRMRMEQNLIDAYLGEGWKGNSREKIKPEKELQRAEAQIMKCKLIIREAMQELETLGLEGSIQDSAFDSQGRLRYDEIFCSKCHSREAFLNNDIILCDGACNRGFHQKCLHPPLATHEIPPEEQGWLCPVCDCKLDCLLTINKYLGTNFEVEANWRDVFPEADPLDSARVQAAEEWPSDDSEDADYDPDKDEPLPTGGNKEDPEVVSSDETGSASDFHPSGEESPVFDSDSESLQGLQSSLGEEKKVTLMPGVGNFIDLESQVPNSMSNEVQLPNRVVLLKDDTDNDFVPIRRKRQRKEVDYKKLNDEIFGKEGLDSEQHTDDEDWGPRKPRRKGKIDIVEIKDGDDSAKSVFGNAENLSAEPTSGQESGLLGSGFGRDSADSGGQSGDGRGICGQASEKKMKIRMPNDVVTRLRGVFAENQLPSKSFKEDLSKQLGISYKKVHVWFRNLRYQALKKGLAEPTKPRTTHQQKTEDSSECRIPIFKHIPAREEEIATRKLKRIKEKERNRDSSLLMEKVYAMQLKVQELRRKMEAVYDFNSESGVVKEKSGKHIVYLPFVELVEKVTEVTVA